MRNETKTSTQFSSSQVVDVPEYTWKSLVVDVRPEDETALTTTTATSTTATTTEKVAATTTTQGKQTGSKKRISPKGTVVSHTNECFDETLDAPRGNVEGESIDGK